jgi:hypothetical protein
MGAVARLRLQLALTFSLAIAWPLSCAEGDQGQYLVDADGDGFDSTVDCDDANADANPKHVERCDGIDNDCDGIVDPPESIDAFEWYIDLDGDGWGVEDGSAIACNQPSGHADQQGDCDDDDAAVYPGAPEDCTIDRDFNCDGSSSWADVDGDGFPACEDCDDTDLHIHPDVLDDCDGIDNDCSGAADDSPIDQLCPEVPNASVVCLGEKGCVIDDCPAEWHDSNQDYADGCECHSEPLPESLAATCETAVDLGALFDNVPTTLTVAGNSSFAGREIWYTFDAVDDVDTNGDEFHVDVRFTANPGPGYAIAVYRNGCPGTGEELAVAEPDVFDWYTDQSFTPMGCTVLAPCGEGNCGVVLGESDKNFCSDNSATFHVRIFRPDGLPSCDPYIVELSNGIY